MAIVKYLYQDVKANGNMEGNDTRVKRGRNKKENIRREKKICLYSLSILMIGIIYCGPGVDLPAS
jgi:hypothetical protein